MPLRIVMMGTGAFAVPAFRALIQSPHHVVGLVTQPDRTGRGHHHHVNLMKETAQAAGIDVFQPENANSPDSLQRLRQYDADLFVVAAYGQILSADLLAIPRWGAINLHGSLLPKFRGAAPIQYAVWKGEAETGVTIFKIEPQLDAGPILGMLRTPIGPKDTSGSVHDRLAELAAGLLLDVVDRIESGTVEMVSQDPSLVTRSPKLKKEQGNIDWSQTSREVDCRIRAMQPWPMPYSFLHVPGREPVRTLILEIEPSPQSGLEVGHAQVADGCRLLVGTGDGAVEVKRIQPAGKRAMDVEEFLRGTSVAGGWFAQS